MDILVWNYEIGLQNLKKTRLGQKAMVVACFPDSKAYGGHLEPHCWWYIYWTQCHFESNLHGICMSHEKNFAYSVSMVWSRIYFLVNQVIEIILVRVWFFKLRPTHTQTFQTSYMTLFKPIDLIEYILVSMLGFLN